VHVDLQPVSVLVLVDQRVVKAAADVIGERWIAHCLSPVEQEVVIIEHILALFGFDIPSEQLFQLSRPSGAPRERDRGEAEYLVVA
jgi:hypothetical protein